MCVTVGVVHIVSHTSVTPSRRSRTHPAGSPHRVTHKRHVVTPLTHTPGWFTVQVHSSVVDPCLMLCLPPRHLHQLLKANVIPNPSMQPNTRQICCRFEDIAVEGHTHFAKKE
jgi:hypothetical protein